MLQCIYFSAAKTEPWYWKAGNDKAIEFFTVNTKLAEMAVLASKDLTTAKRSYLLNLMQGIITGLRVNCLTNWAKLLCAS